MFKIFLTTLWLILPLHSEAADEGLNGLVINQTMTRFGQDFYAEFVKQWNEYQIVIPANLAVYERPSARWGSQVWIEYRGRRIYYRSIGANMRTIDDTAKQAAAYIFNLMLQEQSALVGDGDELEKDSIY